MLPRWMQSEHQKPFCLKYSIRAYVSHIATKSFLNRESVSRKQQNQCWYTWLWLFCGSNSRWSFWLDADCLSTTHLFLSVNLYKAAATCLFPFFGTSPFLPLSKITFCPFRTNCCIKCLYNFMSSAKSINSLFLKLFVFNQNIGLCRALTYNEPLSF